MIFDGKREVETLTVVKTVVMDSMFLLSRGCIQCASVASKNRGRRGGEVKLRGRRKVVKCHF